MSRERREILGPFYALLGVVCLAAVLAAVAVSTTQLADRDRRARLERFHLRGVMLTFESLKRLGEIRRELPALDGPRSLRGHTYGLGQAVRLLGELHRATPVTDEVFVATVERLQREYDELVPLVDTVPFPGHELSSALSELELTAFQLDRLHTNAAQELLVELERSADAAAIRAIASLVLVLLATGLLSARILTVLRARLREHERTRRALEDQERQLRLSSKLEALGSLVGGVAHDFNNVLTTIVGNADLLEEKVGTNGPARRHVAEIREASERVAAMIRQMLAFSRQQPVDLEPTDLRRTVERIEPMLRRLIREDIELDVRCDGAPCVSEVDPSQVEQALLNLAVNARDAMPDGGRLSIRIERVDETPGRTRILVEDTGQGMSEETAARAFDPFFTTKEPGEGTGLGLATVHGIVTKLGGEVRLASHVGRGTRVELLLPCSVGPPPGD